MITIAELKKYAELKGINIEINYPKSYSIEPSDSIAKLLSVTTYTFEVGIELKKNVWYWWTNFISEIKDFEDDLMFRNRYNCNNGYEIKSHNKGFQAEIVIRGFLYIANQKELAS